MKLSDKIEISGEIATRQIGEETTLVDIGDGTRFGLSPVAAHFWQLLESGNTPAQARDVMLTEYDVDPAELDSDLETLLSELAAKGLVKLL